MSLSMGSAKKTKFQNTTKPLELVNGLENMFGSVSEIYHYIIEVKAVGLEQRFRYRWREKRCLCNVTIIKIRLL